MLDRIQRFIRALYCVLMGHDWRVDSSALYCAVCQFAQPY
jgi:hypothetical protein